jgi:uncharacterized LabA/DUF88 family protein
LAKVAILVDNMYLEHAAGLYKAWPADPTKLPKVVLAPTDEFYKTYIFDALPFAPKENASQDQLNRRKKKADYLNALEYQEHISVEKGYVMPRIRTCPNCSTQVAVPVQKLVDVLISVRLVSLSWSDVVDKIVLVSGDGDLVPAVREAENSANKLVKLVYVKGQNVDTSDSLRKACSENKELTPQELQYLKFDKSAHLIG